MAIKHIGTGSEWSMLWRKDISSMSHHNPHQHEQQRLIQQEQHNFQQRHQQQLQHHQQIHQQFVEQTQHQHRVAGGGAASPVVAKSFLAIFAIIFAVCIAVILVVIAVIVAFGIFAVGHLPQ
jgi:Flp pilus assembly protein TadB